MTLALRAWQSSCIGSAVKHYRDNRHFFCQATPGAGKTLMAAELAKQLYQDNEIDLVLCFAPTIQVVDSFRMTLEAIIDAVFDGQLGSLGCVLTYQAMAHRDKRFWSLFNQHRVLVIFDEIHHCASQEVLAGNVWGQQIAERIQAKAKFTLALSGTPWRTDQGLVALARYSVPEGEIVRDYVYGLEQAIEDEVCRRPRIVLLDNECIERTQVKRNEYSSEYFSSIRDLLINSDTRYQQFLEQDKAIRKILEIANARLSVIRKEKPDAGGLVVASNVLHANQIADILSQLGEECTLVSYQNNRSQQEINSFRHGTSRWIVSVGMISEGTDIPRLQVCCYLSRVRTELYLRQVLGRILRRNNSIDELAWLYLYVEPKLEEFCYHIKNDLPDDHRVVSRLATSEMDISNGKLSGGQTLTQPSETQILLDSIEDAEAGLIQHAPQLPTTINIHLSDAYRQRVLDLFLCSSNSLDNRAI